MYMCKEVDMCVFVCVCMLKTRVSASQHALSKPRDAFSCDACWRTHLVSGAILRDLEVVKKRSMGRF